MSLPTALHDPRLQPYRTGLWERSWVFALIFSLIIWFCSPVMAVERGLADDQLRLLNEAVAQIRTHALNLPASPRRIGDDILRAYTRSLDPYSDYLTTREYAAFLESTSSDYFGVQMDLQEKNGMLRLYPFKGGMAEKSGIRAGDELLAVNGAPVYGQSIYVVGSQIRGEEGTSLQLTLRTGQALARSLSLRRSMAHYQSVLWHPGPGAHLIEITRFTRDTAEQLRRILVQIHGDKLVLLDLRGNQGGSLIDARTCADFFVEQGRVLFRLRDREGERVITAEQPALLHNSVVVLQDGATASAAEAFILALRAGRRGTSAGETSYGKGLAQRFLPLADGSALRLTYAEILAPDRSSYHGRGLNPERILPRQLVEADLTNSKEMKSLLKFLQVTAN
ncbi:MAG: S41 family peptidase [Desulfobulbus sp.]|nr:S41 family peptidase [Desulfobulbus sp.]